MSMDVRNEKQGGVELTIKKICAEKVDMNISGKPQEEIKPEDHPDRYPGHLSMLLIYLWWCFSVSCFSYLIPISVEFTEFLGQSQFMAGCVVAITCFVSSVVCPFAYLFAYKYGLRISFIVCTLFFMAGMFLTILACPLKSFAVLLIGRCVGGVGIGFTFISNWYTARAVGINRRTQVNQYMTAAIGSGYAIGPLISAGMYAVGKSGVVYKEHTSGTNQIVESYDNIWWNRVTSPAWIIIALLCIQLLAFAFCFKEPTKESKENSSRDKVEGSSSPLRGILNMKLSEKISLSFNMLAVFFLPMIISSWEIVSVNEAVFTWGWKIETASVYVGIMFLLLIPATVFITQFAARLKIPDRAGMVGFGTVAVVGFFFLWDYFPSSKKIGPIIMYMCGSFLVLTGFQLARGFCWSLISKQIPTHSKGLANMIMFVIFNAGRGAGALIADCFRTDVQSLPEVDYSERGFVAWSPRNSYAWSMQLVCLFVTLIWGVLYKTMKPCEGSS